MTRRLLYVADPMCSWCWGFAPIADALVAHYAGAFRPVLLMGGLRPWNTTPMRTEDKATIRGHWEHVAHESGQPFDLSFFDRPNFVYDTEPAARAVVVMSAMQQAPAFGYLSAVQRAFYAHNQDVTDPAVLGAIAQAQGVDADAFDEIFSSDAAKEETRSQFESSQRLGVRGFPSVLAAGADGRGAVITIGYAPLATLTERLDAFIAQTPDAA